MNCSSQVTLPFLIVLPLTALVLRLFPFPLAKVKSPLKYYQIFFNYKEEIGKGLEKTYQFTDSVQGGVVKEPL